MHGDLINIDSLPDVNNSHYIVRSRRGGGSATRDARFLLGLISFIFMQFHQKSFCPTLPSVSRVHHPKISVSSRIPDKLVADPGGASRRAATTPLLPHTIIRIQIIFNFIWLFCSGWDLELSHARNPGSATADILFLMTKFEIIWSLVPVAFIILARLTQIVW